MQFTAQLLEFWWILPLLFITVLLKSPSVKGFFGELYIRGSAKYFLDKSIYHAVHNVTLDTLDGTTQIDHIFVSQYGIFVVETKNYSGWIYGDASNATWTQKLYKRTYKFQNPLHQNYKHLRALENTLKISSEKFHSVVVFVGDSTFKTRMPPNVVRADNYIRYIKSINVPIISATEVQAILGIIQNKRLSPTFSTNRQHVRNLQAKFDGTTPMHCPKCGSNMTLRTVKNGKGAGKQFWGCSQFPKCRYKMQKSDDGVLRKAKNVVPFKKPE